MSAPFVTTHWSVVAEAGAESSPRALEALAQLCRAYWSPLYAYVRKRGHDTHDAQDLVQAFFERVIEKNYIGAADRQRGRFRTFLLAAMEHFLAKEWKRGQRLKRGGGYTLIPLDGETAEGCCRAELADEMSPEKIYDRRWTFTVLEQALAKLQKEYASSAHGPLFEALAVVLSGDRPDCSYQEIGARFDMSEGAVKVAVHRLRRRYGELVRAEIAETVSRPELVEEEIRNLFASLAG